MLTVQVHGAERLGRAFGRAALRSSDLSGAWSRIGAAVKADAVRLAPVLTGELRRSIRAGRSKSQATVRVGRPTMDKFVKTVHYGGYASGSYGPHYIKANPFMTIAVQSNRGKAEHEVDVEIKRLLRQCGIK